MYMPIDIPSQFQILDLSRQPHSHYYNSLFKEKNSYSCELKVNIRMALWFMKIMTGKIFFLASERGRGIEERKKEREIA